MKWPAEYKSIILKDPRNELKKQAAKILKDVSHIEGVKITQTETYIEVEKSPASVFVVVTDENWNSNTESYRIDHPFTSRARISHMSANKYGIGERAQKGIATRLLCIAVCILVLDDKLTPRSMVVAEVDKSVDDRLLTKVYTPFGFRLVSRFDSDDTGGLVMCYARTIIQKCNKCMRICY